MSCCSVCLSTLLLAAVWLQIAPIHHILLEKIEEII